LNASKHATKLLCQLGSFRSNGDVTSSKFNRCQSDPHGLMQGRYRPRLAGAFLRDMNLFVPAKQLAKILDLRRLHLQDFRFLLLIPRPWNRLRDLSALDTLATIHHSNKLANPVINASQHVEHRVEPEPVLTIDRTDQRVIVRKVADHSPTVRPCKVLSGYIPPTQASVNQGRFKRGRILGVELD